MLVRVADARPDDQLLRHESEYRVLEAASNRIPMVDAGELVVQVGISSERAEAAGQRS